MGTVADSFITNVTTSGQLETAVASIPDTVLAGLRSVRGVRGGVSQITAKASGTRCRAAPSRPPR
jgi:hypothetical protein